MKTEWKKCKLGEVASFQNGFAFKSQDFKSKGKYHIIRIKELKNGLVRFFDDTVKIQNIETYVEKKFLVNKNDILFALTGDPINKNNPLSWVGRVAKYTYNDLALLNQRVAKLIPSETVDKDFVYYHFRCFDNFYSLASKATGSASQANISTKTIENEEIFLPPLPVQKKIAGILKSLDDKIELNRQISKNLEEQAQAIFKDWFIDHPKSDWKIGKLSEIAEITMGQSPDGSSYNENKMGVVFYQGRAEFGFRFPTQRLFTTQPKRMAKRNDILLSVRAPVGDINVANENCCIGRGLAAIHSRDNHQSFLLYTMYSLKEKLDIYNAQGTVFGCINRDALNDLEIVIPPRDTIDKFEKIASSLDAKIAEKNAESTHLTQIRDTILPKLMSGEIEV